MGDTRGHFTQGAEARNMGQLLLVLQGPFCRFLAFRNIPKHDHTTKDSPTFGAYGGAGVICRKAASVLFPEKVVLDKTRRVLPK